jgi:hypothetical protein
LGENLSFLDQSQQLSAQASAANIQAAGYMDKANTGQAVANMATSWAGYQGGAKPQGTS